MWEGLKQRRGKQDGTRAMIDLLILGRTHGYDALREAIEKTLAIGCTDVSAVVLLLKAGGGLYWLIPAAVTSLLGGVVNAWLFLVKVTS